MPYNWSPGGAYARHADDAHDRIGQQVLCDLIDQGRADGRPRRRQKGDAEGGGVISPTLEFRSQQVGDQLGDGVLAGEGPGQQVGLGGKHLLQHLLLGRFQERDSKRFAVAELRHIVPGRSPDDELARAPRPDACEHRHRSDPGQRWGRRDRRSRRCKRRPGVQRAARLGGHSTKSARRGNGHPLRRPQLYLRLDQPSSPPGSLSSQVNLPLYRSGRPTAAQASSRRDLPAR